MQDIGGLAVKKADGSPSAIHGTGWVINNFDVKRRNRERECRLIYVKDECWRRCNFIRDGPSDTHFCSAREAPWRGRVIGGRRYK